jgi:DNA-directed RNA polymerase specialized sigma24 family protein
MRFFGGLTVEEIGEVLDVSPRTVKREWSISKRWLKRELAALA